MARGFGGRVQAPRRLGLLGFAVMSVLAAGQLAGNCVDGVTPDCSDPSVCSPFQGDASSDGPRLDGSADGASETDADTSDARDGDSDGDVRDAAGD